MANLACWCKTQIPSDILFGFNKDMDGRDTASILEQSTVFAGSAESTDEGGKGTVKDIRKSKNFWVPTNYWIGGWVWYYIQKMNRENFKYDILDIEDDHIQYTHYDIGDYYHWHSDTELSRYEPNTENVRKLSFTVQISSPNEYTGGELEFLDLDNESFLAPKDFGSVIVFDSRVRHRVCKVKTGVRKSLVGWVVGPRWR